MTVGDSSDDFGFNPKAPRGRPTQEESAHRRALSDIEDDSYDPGEFYVASTNAHDHDEVMRIKMPKYMVVLLQDLVRDTRLPAYRSVHDIVRDALVHRARQLKDMDITDADLDWVETEIASGSLARLASHQERKQATVEEIRERLTAANQANDLEQLEMALAVAGAVAEKLGKPYDDQVRLEIARAITTASDARNIDPELLFQYER